MQGYNWYDLVGNIGVFMILSAYFMLQLNRMDSRSILYSLMNFFGALMILISPQRCKKCEGSKFKAPRLQL